MLPWSAPGTRSIQTAWHRAQSLTWVERSRSGCRSPRGSPGFAKSRVWRSYGAKECASRVCMPAYGATGCTILK
eukprot:1778606-Rhodomonas_salina.1